MAVDFLEEIYQEANLILSLKKMRKYGYCGMEKLLEDEWNEQKERIAAFCRRTAGWEEKLGITIWNSITAIRDYMVRGDILSAADLIDELIPAMYEAMSLRGQIDVSEGNYRLFSSRSGFLSVQSISQNKNIISCVDPAFEAYTKALDLCRLGKKSFCTLGCELGYLAWQMYEVSNGSMDIYIYEVDDWKIAHAREYGVLDWIPEDKKHVIINEDVNILISEIKKNHLTGEDECFTAFYVEKDFYSRLSDEFKSIVRLIQNEVTTGLNFADTVERNFYRNVGAVKKYISDINKEMFKKSWIVVGGGPSVDYNIEYIRSSIGKKTIVAATTILKRLIKEGIRPDFAIAVDMQNRTFKHLEGIEDNDIPLIMSDCSSWMFGELYKGKKYLIPTEGMYFSKDLYKAKGIKAWKTYGTVTAAAIEIAIGMGAESIDLVGLDFAYPDQNSHAAGTMDYKTNTSDAQLKVPSVDGGMVSTDNLLKSYLDEVGSIIAGNPKVAFYNRSKNGAYIHGCK